MGGNQIKIYFIFVLKKILKVKMFPSHPSFEGIFCQAASV
jgi:hypothetical protein